MIGGSTRSSTTSGESSTLGTADGRPRRHAGQHQQDGCGDFQADRNEGDNRDDDQQADEELDGIQHRILLIIQAMCSRATQSREPRSPRLSQRRLGRGCLQSGWGGIIKR